MIIHNENQGGEYAGKKYETKSFPDVTGKVFVKSRQQRNLLK